MNRKLIVDWVTRGTVSLAILIGASGRVQAQGGQPLNPDNPNQPQAITTQVGSAFSYQGQIKKSGSAVNGACDFQFSLWNDGGAGAQIGNIQTQNGIVVKNGLFTTQLDFGNRFTGDIRWLQIAVKCAGDSGFIVLGRQMLTSSPYALGLMPETIVNGNVPENRGVIRANNTGAGFGLWGESANGAGVVGVSKGAWIGVYGESAQYHGIVGTAFSQYHSGVVGENKGDGWGVYGLSKGSGVVGKSLGSGIGVYGESKDYEGVRGVSYNINHGAIVGVHEGGGWGMYGLSKGNGIVGESTNGAVGVFGRSSGGTQGTGVWGESSTGAGVVGVNTANWIGVYGKSTNFHGIYAESASATNAALYAKNTGGGKAAFFDGRATTRIFEIIGGSDLAERFNLSIEAEPGTLLVIDEVKPGLLKPSTTTYDTKIAGIVSGAGGVNPGLTLHQEGVLEGNTEVAIAGRVYVKATTANGAIKPGDLLTTSDVAGYAMKATDRERAYGAVIGKAMTGLESGTGLVLVLVNLQ